MPPPTTINNGGRFNSNLLRVLMSPNLILSLDSAGSF